MALRYGTLLLDFVLLSEDLRFFVFVFKAWKHGVDDEEGYQDVNANQKGSVFLVWFFRWLFWWFRLFGNWLLSGCWLLW